MKPRSTLDALFLAPPHSHDPCDVSEVAALPSSMLMQLPEPVQEALWTLQESTSIVYASYLRLQTLMNERFERLIPLPSRQGDAMISCKSTQHVGNTLEVWAESGQTLKEHFSTMSII